MRITVQIEVGDGKAIWKSRVLVFRTLGSAVGTIVSLLVQAWMRFQKEETGGGEQNEQAVE